MKTCLASIPTYLVSVIKFPKWAINLINSQIAHCFWDNYEGHHKYDLANWELLTQKVEYGGLGIPTLGDINLCLLASWVKRYHPGENKLWKHIIDHKYSPDAPKKLSVPRSVPYLFGRV